MTNYKISQLTTAAPAAADLIPFVDVDDTGTAPAGSSGSDKATTAGNLLSWLTSTVFSAAGITTNTGGTYTANVLSVAKLVIPWPATLTGIAVYNGGTVTGNLLVALFNSAGTQVAVSASTAQAGTFAVQQVPFTSPYAAVAGIYYYGVLGSSSTQTFAIMDAFNNAATPAQGGFTMPASISPPAATGSAAYIVQASTY